MSPILVASVVSSQRHRRKNPIKYQKEDDNNNSCAYGSLKIFLIVFICLIIFL